MAEMGYRLYWRLPPLFDADNFKGEQQNIFLGVVSLNMLCIPQERNTVVQGLRRSIRSTGPIR